MVGTVNVSKDTDMYYVLTIPELFVVAFRRMIIEINIIRTYAGEPTLFNIQEVAA